MGIYCDKCGHYNEWGEEKLSKSEWEYRKFMFNLELDGYVEDAIANPNLIKIWEDAKREIAKDLTVSDCNFQHNFLDNIKAKVKEHNEKGV